MKFLVRKRRNTPTVIIIALIDVLIVLVIFLLVTTTFKQVPSLKLTLPASRQALKPGVADNPPQVVTISSNGVVFLGANNMPYTVEQLQNQLAAMAAQNPKLKLAVRADKDAPWGRMVAVMDAAKAAKITDISAFTKQEGKP
ncbi:MAG TPA: biopolymer transporter ExbD [Verrucomicrobiae bacterium]|nr:biopolymer transporter ExbD [Verrucomicrobiae bacterium]